MVCYMHSIGVEGVNACWFFNCWAKIQLWG